MLRISEVARRVGISSSALRAWEASWTCYAAAHGKPLPALHRSGRAALAAGHVPSTRARPESRRHRSRVEAAGDRFARRSEAAAALPGQRFRRLRTRRGLSLAQVARATGVSIGFLSALERGQMRSSVATLQRIARFYRTNILSFFEAARRKSAPGAARRNEKFWRPPPACVWNCSPGETPPWSLISSA